MENFGSERGMAMGTSGRYIGTPNGIVLCVSRNDNGMIGGRLYHGYSAEGIPFRGYEDIIKTAETLFDALGFPCRGSGDRDIYGQIRRTEKKEGMTRVMSDEELLGQHGDMGTFVIRVQHRQHASWQGEVTWIDGQKKESFRSALELVRLIDGALNGEDKAFGQ